jgi:endogenous inhibitor of DNA gyrase (YacG/DUF329 family)
MSVPKRKSVPCPKCGRNLLQSGEVVVGDETLPTFQCDECVKVVDFLGQKMELALTFALDKDGKPFDPADENGDVV